ncbi:MAG: hypothetical protein IJ537_01160 [Bacteroidaceae bacterium]|nr:hypothetical protein [Bacteroidaceae bacterium]
MKKVLQVKKKAVPLQPHFRGKASLATLKGMPKLLKRHIVGEVAELVDALL